jgi:hypothetical protein
VKQEDAIRWNAKKECTPPTGPKQMQETIAKKGCVKTRANISWVTGETPKEAPSFKRDRLCRSGRSRTFKNVDVVCELRSSV